MLIRKQRKQENRGQTRFFGLLFGNYSSNNKKLLNLPSPAGGRGVGVRDVLHVKQRHQLLKPPHPLPFSRLREKGDTLT
jgi:hypothetical protein